MKLVKDAIINGRGHEASGSCLVTCGLYDISLRRGLLSRMRGRKSSCRKYLACISMDSRIIFVHLHYRAASRRSVSRLQPVTLALLFSCLETLKNSIHLLHPPPDEIQIGPRSLWSWRRRVWISLAGRRVVAVGSDILCRGLLLLCLLKFLLLWVPIFDLRLLLPCQSPLLTSRQSRSCCCCTSEKNWRRFLRP